MRVEANGTWTDYVVATGLPALVNGIEQTGKDVADADDLVDVLHRFRY